MLEKEDHFQSVIRLLLSTTCMSLNTYIQSVACTFWWCLLAGHWITCTGFPPSFRSLNRWRSWMCLHSWMSLIWDKAQNKNPLCPQISWMLQRMSVLFLEDSQVSTRFFSKLMLHRRERFSRPDRLLILLEERSRTCRLLRASNPSITCSRFPLLMQTGKRTYLKQKGHNTHEYACVHKGLYFIHRHWFLLINIKGATVALRGACTSSPQCWVEWQAGLSLLNPDRWGLTAQQMLRWKHSTLSNQRTGPELSTLVGVPRLLLTPFYPLKLLSSCLATPQPALAKHAAWQRAAVSGGGWLCWSHEALGQCCDGLWNRPPDSSVLFGEAPCAEEGSGMGWDGCWIDKVWVSASVSSLKLWPPVPKQSWAGRKSESSDNEETAT